LAKSSYYKNCIDTLIRSGACMQFNNKQVKQRMLRRSEQIANLLSQIKNQWSDATQVSWASKHREVCVMCGAAHTAWCSSVLGLKWLKIADDLLSGLNCLHKGWVLLPQEWSEEIRCLKVSVQASLTPATGFGLFPKQRKCRMWSNV